MNLESMKKLRLDRRLQRRSGWIAASELEAELANLPDVGDKVHVPADDEEETSAAAESAPAAEATPAPAGDAPEGGTPIGGGA